MDKASLLADPPISLSEADLEVLHQTDAEYSPHTWAELRAVCASKDTSSLRRSPTDAWNYLRWHRATAAKYPSVASYIVNEKLGGDWDFVADTLLADGTYAIRRNDWPYGCASDVAHLLVWSKVPIKLDEQGDPVPEDERRIAEFVKAVFEDRLVGGGGEVLWFRNRSGFQSVRALEHFHVLLRNVDDARVAEWTGQQSHQITAAQWRRKAFD